MVLELTKRAKAKARQNLMTLGPKWTATPPRGSRALSEERSLERLQKPKLPAKTQSFEPVLLPVAQTLPVAQGPGRQQISLLREP